MELSEEDLQRVYLSLCGGFAGKVEPTCNLHIQILKLDLRKVNREVCDEKLQALFEFVYPDDDFDRLICPNITALEAKKGVRDKGNITMSRAPNEIVRPSKRPRQIIERCAVCSKEKPTMRRCWACYNPVCMACSYWCTFCPKTPEGWKYNVCRECYDTSLYIEKRGKTYLCARHRH